VAQVIMYQQLAARLGVDPDSWTTEQIMQADEVIEGVEVFVSALTGLDFDTIDYLPRPVKVATLSIASRHFLERQSSLADFRLGDYSEKYLSPGTWTAEDLTSFEKTLLGPWLTKSSGFGSIRISGMGTGSGYGYVPVQGTDKPFPFLEDD